VQCLAQTTFAPVFEVSTVKVNRSGDSGSESSFSNGRFTATNVTLKNLMEYSAFGLPGARIVGGPKWIDSERFDIEAKVDSAAAAAIEKLSREQGRIASHAMFQRLLTDRFKLTTHWETREMPVYALVVAKNGPRLQKAARPDAGADTSASTGRLTANEITMDGLARTLTQEMADELGRVVVDRTGIQGKYDVKLRWTPATESGSGSADNGTAPDTGPSLFTAIQEQLGLKLESSKGPVEVLIVDHAEEPSGN
jgi:uncharacterized protein (TIGR03435 family)